MKAFRVILQQLAGAVLALSLPALAAAQPVTTGHLTAELVRRWVLGDRPPHSLDLILQHETAEKLSAPGTRSGALLACAGEATFVARLPREATNPPSRVNLAVWRFRRERDIDPDGPVCAQTPRLPFRGTEVHTAAADQRRPATGGCGLEIHRVQREERFAFDDATLDKVRS